MIAAAAPGAIAEARALRRGEVTGSTYLKRRLREGGLAGASRGAAKIAERIGKATTGVAAQAQAGGRAAGVAAVVGAIAEVPAVVRRDLSLRDYAENRGIDAIDGGGGKLAGSLMIAGAAAAPFEAPAIAVGAGLVGAGMLTSRAVRPVRSWVTDRQLERRRRNEHQADDEEDRDPPNGES